MKKLKKIGMNYLIKLINSIISSLFFSIFNYKLCGSIWSGFMIDENNNNIGYEGMRSFAIVKGNLTSDDLSYWLNKKELYVPGLMKADYGTFLTSLLVIYENDRVADKSASKFNVIWSRVSPVCVSLCNDYNCLQVILIILWVVRLWVMQVVFGFLQSHTHQNQLRKPYFNVFLGALIILQKYYSKTAIQQLSEN